MAPSASGGGQSSIRKFIAVCINSFFKELGYNLFFPCVPFSTLPSSSTIIETNDESVVGMVLQGHIRTVGTNLVILMNFFR